MREIRHGVWLDEPMGKRTLTRAELETDIRGVLSKWFYGSHLEGAYRAKFTPAAKEIADLVIAMGLTLPEEPERNKDAGSEKPGSEA